MRTFQRTAKLSAVRCDIRGPLFEEANRLAAQGHDVLRLNTGNPATFGFSAPEELLRIVQDAVPKSQGYCDAKGLPAAREAIAAYHRSKGIANAEAQDVFIGNGLSELIELLTYTLLDTGDEILIPSPDYPLWTNAVRMAGGTAVHYVCDERNDWNPDIDDIRKKITPRTRAIVVINPNNPTGALYSQETLQQIADLAAAHELMIFADEIYDRLLMPGQEHISLASLAPDTFCVTLNGLSKSHLICGLRCGWACFSGNKEAGRDYIDAVNMLVSLRLCSNASVQHVVVASLADLASVQAMYQPGGRLYEQITTVVEEIKKIPALTAVAPKGAFYIFPKLSDKLHITNDEQFAMDLLREKHILLINGRGFNWPEPNHFRIVCLPQADHLRQAMRDLGDFLDTYHQ